MLKPDSVLQAFQFFFIKGSSRLGTVGANLDRCDIQHLIISAKLQIHRTHLTLSPKAISEPAVHTYQSCQAAACPYSYYLTRQK